ncbi:MAG: hypothetical protein E7397_06360 [Ruminococcaceae bacterium]|nr:hypothetical protein [Oscillospiraceae bacterium]
MIKRFIYSLLLVLICVSGTVVSAQIEIEGEHFSAMAGRRGVAAANAGASGGAYLDILYIPSADTYTEVYYTVTAENAGWYRFVVTGSTPNDVWTSPFFVTVNDGETMDAKAVSRETMLAAPFSPVAKEIDLGCVYLRQGKNRVKFFVKEKRSQDGYLLLYLDKLTFSEPVFGVQNVLPGQESGNFLEERNIRFTLTTTYPDSVAHRLYLSVLDATEAKVIHEPLTIAPNSSEYPLNLGILECGDYQLVLQDESENELYRTAFSVVSKEKEATFPERIIQAIKEKTQQIFRTGTENGGGI